MKRIITVLILVLIAALAGCTTSCWTHPTADKQTFLHDRYACERDMRQSGMYGEGLVGAINAGQFFNRCMESNGYSSTTNCH